MSYLGSSAAPLPVAFAGVNGQSFNGGTNTFTLSRSVSKTTDIELVVNNVQQNPYDGSYSVSGNVLTTAESVSAGVANVYVQYLDAPLGSLSDPAAVKKVGDAMTGTLGIKALLETATITAAAPAATTHYDVATQAVQFYTTNATSNFTLNLRANSSASLDSIMAVGQSATIALLVTNGATPYYPTAFTVDGSAVTPKWQGGSAPTTGNASSIDIYSITAIKTAAATFTLLVSQSQFK